MTAEEITSNHAEQDADFEGHENNTEESMGFMGEAQSQLRSNSSPIRDLDTEARERHRRWQRTMPILDGANRTRALLRFIHPNWLS